MSSTSVRTIFTQTERHADRVMNKDKMKEPGKERCLEQERHVKRRLKKESKRCNI